MKNFYFNKFEYAKGNLPKAWILLRDAINCNSNHNSTIKEIHCNNVTLTDPVAIAKSFNEYFVSIEPNLDSKIPPVSSRSMFSVYN